MPLPPNFTFHIAGFDEIKYHRKDKINYFIGFNHPGQLPEFKYSRDLVRNLLGDTFKGFAIHEVHDAYTKSHKNQGCKMPDQQLVKDIISDAIIIEDYLKQGEQINLLCGCAAGISRSTATAYIILCYLLGEWNEREALNLVKQERCEARPNALMVKLADSLLDRKYKMLSPLRNHLDVKWFDQQELGMEVLADKQFKKLENK